MVEHFFRDLCTPPLERGVSRSVPDLIAAIAEYAKLYNENPKPYVWAAKAKDVLQKIIRANSRVIFQTE